MNNHSNDERIARLEGTTERILVELVQVRGEARHSHDELKGHIIRSADANRSEMKELRTEVRDTTKELRRDIRLLLGVQFSLSLALVGVMAKGFGWV